MKPTPFSIHTAFELLYGHTPETCPHCFKPRHREPCVAQLMYERALSGFDTETSKTP